MSKDEYRGEKKEKSELAKKEEATLAFWKEHEIFEKSLDQTKDGEPFVFYEGPPTANGRPGIHHLEARAFKDAIPRYKTMQGYYVRRKGGWDTHGLPVELEVEKQLGMTSKKEVEEYGIEEFNKKCKESVWKYVDEWQDFTERIGYWVDGDDPYITYKPDYIESLWNVVGEAHKKNLLYKDYKVIPWCPRCQTALSSHELAQGYETVKDLSVYVAFKLRDSDEYVLAWTTTPWTLPANVALAVGADIDYVLVEIEGKHIWLAKERLQDVFPEAKMEREVKGKDLIGKEYEPLYPYLNILLPEDQKENLKNAYKIYDADFVTTEDGSGVVHTAVMYGIDDFEFGTQVGLPKFHLVNPDGTFIEGTDFLEGRFVRDEDVAIDIIKDLAKKELLLKKEKYEHTYPFCWRCKTGLLYYARGSWYIRMTELRDQMVKENKEIHWEPEYIRDGRFGEWLAEVKDWAISRERYWATPLPVWMNEKGEYEVISSRDELMERVPEKISKIFVIRHAESEKNVKHVYDSSLDTYALTPKGEDMAHKLAQTLKEEGIDLIYSSPVRRARETAEILGKELGIEITLADELKEMYSGEWEGKSIYDLGEEYEERKKLSDEAYFNTPHDKDGENLAQVEKRAAPFVQKVIRENPGKKIAFISHMGVNMGILKTLKGWNEEDVRKETKKYKGCTEYAQPTKVYIDREREVELDMHRPYIDRFSWDGYTRIPEVMDVWFDSGAMPFAQDHYPFETKEILYPADFISEAIDQTRGWFYTLHAVGAIMGRGKAYKNVISLGHLVDAEGKKMSKSKGNIVNPWEAADTYGVDPLRFWMYSINQPGDAKSFDEKTVDEVVKKVFNLLDNVCKFYEMFKGGEEEQNSTHILDRWVRTYKNKIISDVTHAFDRYDLITATRIIREFIGDLSQWYVRRSRDRMKGGDAEALGTLHEVLFDLSRLLAPCTPFFAEDLYKRIGGEKESVHLERWPEGGEINESLLTEMNEVRHIISEALEKRTGVKVRQPLARLAISQEVGDEYKEIIKDEVNVKEVIVGNEMVLDIELTDELKKEGVIRELTRGIQELRKSAGLNPGDTITLSLQADPVSRELIEEWKDEIVHATALKDIEYRDFLEGKTIAEHGYSFIISL